MFTLSLTCLQLSLDNCRVSFASFCISTDLTRIFEFLYTPADFILQVHIVSHCLLFKVHFPLTSPFKGLRSGVAPRERLYYSTTLLYFCQPPFLISFGWPEFPFLLAALRHPLQLHPLISLFMVHSLYCLLSLTVRRFGLLSRSNRS